jgi:hypothetical protein
MKIVRIIESPILTKRFRVFLDNGDHYDFGLDGGSTYLDHKDKNKRNAYWARHTANMNERHLIYNLIPSPALFSAFLLWGENTSLDKNIEYLNHLFKR